MRVCRYLAVVLNMLASGAALGQVRPEGVPGSGVAPLDLGAPAVWPEVGGLVQAPGDLAFPWTEWDPKLLGFLANEAPRLPMGFSVGIPNPPARASAEAARDLAAVHAAVAARTADDEHQIRLENEPDALVSDFFFALGLLPTRADAPRTYAHLDRVQNEVLWFTLREKKRFARLRPYQVEPAIVPLIPPPPHASYPSGHASQSMGVALAWARLFPECHRQVVAAAQAIGQRREAAGVHYPSDTTAGQALASSVVAGWEAAGFLSEDVEGPLRREVAGFVPAGCINRP